MDNCIKDIQLKFEGCFCRYNERGLVTKITTNLYNSSPFIKEQQLEYDSKDRIIKNTLINEYGKTEGFVTYEYNDRDRLIMVVETKCYSFGKDDITVTRYSYNEDGSITKWVKSDGYSKKEVTDSHKNIIYSETKCRKKNLIIDIFDSGYDTYTETTQVNRFIDYDKRMFKECILTMKHNNITNMTENRYSFDNPNNDIVFIR
jgi:hypothetical protein